ncbi:MAG: nucleotide exchange factor GrpE [Gammaproteobacteria bacterium]
MKKVDEHKKDAALDSDELKEDADELVESNLSEISTNKSGENDPPDVETDSNVTEIDSLNLEVKALKDELLRSRAEIDNTRKRAEKDIVAAHKYGVERLVQDILPVKDSMDMGLEIPVDSDVSDAFREGMELTSKMFGDFFEKLNVKAINPAGEMFDPEFHQAMMTEPSSDVEKGTVTKVMQQGYLLNDRLVRPALVVVAEKEVNAED